MPKKDLNRYINFKKRLKILKQESTMERRIRKAITEWDLSTYSKAIENDRRKEEGYYVI